MLSKKANSDSSGYLVNISKRKQMFPHGKIITMSDVATSSLSKDVNGDSSTSTPEDAGHVYTVSVFTNVVQVN
jgi:hypothetical protein